MKSNTDELLEIAKNVENSKLTKSKINVERQLLNAIGNFETMLIQKDAEVDYSIQYLNSLDFPRIIFDSVCRNLISNAIKYSHPNRKLKLKIYDQKLDDKIVLVFEDNGIGIDLAEHGDKLFKIGTNFHQNSDSKGVGLYLIKNQLESQGGSIFVESKPSEGTKFIVAFH
jgi:signal transduction histidine kinase